MQGVPRPKRIDLDVARTLRAGGSSFQEIGEKFGVRPDSVRKALNGAQADRSAYFREYFLSRRYGISAADFDLMVERQGGVCAICERRPLATGRNQRVLHVDHSHSGGNTRGLLCSTCNAGLGAFQDDAELLRAAAAYLDRYNAIQQPKRSQK